MEREACEEELSGVGYTPEELGAEVNGDGSVVVTTAPSRANQPGQTIRDAVTPPAEPASPADEPPSVPASLVEPSERMISEAQQKKMGALMREHRITDKATALAFVGEVIGRPVESRNELTLAEASRVIDTLEREPRPEPDGEPGPAGDEAGGSEHDGEDPR